MKGILCTIVLLGGIIFTMMSTTAMLGVRKAKSHRSNSNAEVQLVGSTDRCVRAISLM